MENSELIPGSGRDSDFLPRPGRGVDSWHLPNSDFLHRPGRGVNLLRIYSYEFRGSGKRAPGRPIPMENSELIPGSGRNSDFCLGRAAELIDSEFILTNSGDPGKGPRGAGSLWRIRS